MENIFLDSIKKRIETGEFDKEFKVPFMNKKLMYDVIKGKIKKKIKTDRTPMLTDAEIKIVLEEMKEAAGSTFYLFVQYGILEETKEGYQLSSKGKKALFESSKI